MESTILTPLVQLIVALCRPAVVLAACLAFAGAEPARAGDPPLARAESAAAASDWAGVEAAAAEISPLDPGADFADADRRLMQMAEAAEASGSDEALIAIMGKVADIRALSLDAADPLAARTQVFVAERLIAAGNRGAARMRLDRADHLFAQVTPPVPAEHATALLLLADCLERTMEPENAFAALVRADALLAASQPGSPDATTAAIRASEAGLRLGAYAVAADIAERAAGSTDDTGSSARLRLVAGDARLALGERAAAEDLLRAALDRADPADQTVRLRIVASLADVAAGSGRRAEAIAALGAAVADAETAAATNPAGVVMGRNRLAGLLLEDDRPAEALQAYRLVLTGIDALGLDDAALADTRASVLTNVTHALLKLGRPEAARDTAALAYAASLLLGTGGDDRVATVLAYAEALAASGDLEGAAERFKEARDLAPIAEDLPRTTALLVARDTGRFLLRNAGEAMPATEILRPAVAAFGRGATEPGLRANHGREAEGEIARLLVAALWRVSRPGQR